jgi:hypothetical protein
MLQRLGNVIYWTTSGAAVLCFFFGVLIAVGAEMLHDQVGAIVAYSVVGGLIWLAGKAARYVLAG